jgi:hypothetical protein
LAFFALLVESVHSFKARRTSSLRITKALCPRLESATQYLGKLPGDQFQDAAAAKMIGKSKAAKQAHCCTAF